MTNKPSSKFVRIKLSFEGKTAEIANSRIKAEQFQSFGEESNKTTAEFPVEFARLNSDVLATDDFCPFSTDPTLSQSHVFSKSEWRLQLL
jgi:hypothetical protein